LNKNGFIPIAIAQTVISLFWLGFVIFIPAGVIYSIKIDPQNRAIWVWGTAFIFIFFLALASTIILRWRLMAMPFLLILIAQGIHAPAYKYTVLLSIIGVVSLLITYVGLKYIF